MNWMRALILAACLWLTGPAQALDIELGKAAWTHNQGGGWNYVTTGGCSGWQLHKLASGRELDMTDRGNNLQGSMKATFPGPDGKYDVTIVLRAWSNCCAKWAVLMNGTRLGGGSTPMTSNCAKCARCNGNCQPVSVLKGVTVKKGATVVVWGEVAWPCSDRGGSYPTFQSVKFTGGATNVTSTASVLSACNIAVRSDRAGALTVSSDKETIQSVRLFGPRGNLVAGTGGGPRSEYRFANITRGMYLVTVTSGQGRSTRAVAVY